MKANKFLIGLIAATLLCVSSGAVLAQTPETVAPTDTTTKTRQRFANKTIETGQKDSTAINAVTVEPQKTAVEKTAPKDSAVVKTVTEDPQKSSVEKNGKSGAADIPSEPVVTGDDVIVAPESTKPSAETQAVDPNRHELPSEEADIVNSYNNFFNTYRLGPEDVISVSVFGQDRYSRSGIIIPPSGRISLALIPGGIFVNGKTVEEVADLIKKRYDEYIIDPQVDVALDKASSYRYSVIGDVAQPGIRLMNRRLTVAEALSEAGGVLETGDRSKVMVLRKQANGVLSPIAVNVSAIYKGKAPDSTYLVPGDQVIVPGNKLKSFQKIMSFIPILSFARIFTGGVF